MKSFRRKNGQDEPPASGRNGERNFHGEKRSNETHASTTDPDARLAKKSGGQESKMGFTGHLLMENRNGLVVDARLTLLPASLSRRRLWICWASCPGRTRRALGQIKITTQRRG